MTSTVRPLETPFRALRSLDNLCFFPSAREAPAASRQITIVTSTRAPHVAALKIGGLMSFFSRLHRLMEELLGCARFVETWISESLVTSKSDPQAARHPKVGAVSFALLSNPFTGLLAFLVSGRLVWEVHVQCQR